MNSVWAPHFNLACWLLRQKAQGSSSPFHPYLAVFPSRIASPLTYPEHILQLFEHRSFIEKVRQ